MGAGGHLRDAERAVEPTEHDERRRHEAELDDLGVREVPPQARDHRGVDRRVITRETPGKVECRRLGVRARGLAGELR